MNCEICSMWNDMEGKSILKPARYVGAWGNGKPVHLCRGCKSSGAGWGNGTPVPIDDYYQETRMPARGVSLVKLTKPAATQPTESALALRRLRNQVNYGLTKNDAQALRTAFTLSAAIPLDIHTVGGVS